MKRKSPEISQLLIYTPSITRSQGSEWAAQIAVRRWKKGSHLHDGPQTCQHHPVLCISSFSSLCFFSSLFFFFPFTLESYTELSLLKQKLFKQFTQTHPEMCGSNEKLAQFSLDAIPAWSTMPDCLLLPDFMIIRNICKKKTTASE